jgi:hypothetical protein
MARMRRGGVAWGGQHDGEHGVWRVRRGGRACCPQWPVDAHLQCPTDPLDPHISNPHAQAWLPLSPPCPAHASDLFSTPRRRTFAGLLVISFIDVTPSMRSTCAPTP